MTVPGDSDPTRREDSVMAAVAAFIDLHAASQSVDLDQFVARYPSAIQRTIEARCRDYLAFDDAVGADRAPDQETGDGRRLGEFELVEELGRGGMGVVYLAVQQPLGRKVALKVLASGFGMSERHKDRFRLEAAAASRLNHANIVPVYAYGEVDGSLYYAMEFVAGSDLAQVLAELRRGRAATGSEDAATPAATLDPADRTPSPKRPQSRGLRRRIGVEPRLGYRAEVAELVAQVADGLHYAHCQGIVHRDVKPSNVLVGADGRPRLTDFGLAKDLIDSGHSLSRSGELTGTPHYMSPEQTLARRAPIDQRTDVFSLGVILYELLSLRRPFEGEDLQQLILQICFHDPPSITRINADVPRDLATICEKALEKDPDRRYQTAEEMAQDLRAFLEFRPIQARPSGWVTRSFKVLRRHRTATVAAAAVLVTATVGVVWNRVDAADSRRTAIEKLEQAEGALHDGSWDRASDLAVEARSRRPDDEDVRLRAEAVTLAIEAQRQSRERRRAEGERLFAEALRVRESDSDRAIQLALAGVERRPGPEGSAVVMAALAGWRRSDEVVLPNSSVSYAPLWVADESALLALKPRGGLYRFDADDLTKAPVALEVRGRILRAAVVSADGNRAAVVAFADRQSTVLDARTGRVLRVHAFGGTATQAAALSPDGAILATASKSEESIDVLDVETSEARVLDQGMRFVEALEFGPTGRYLVASLRDHSVRVYDLQTKTKRVFGGSEEPPVICQAAIDPAGVWFAHTEAGAVVVRSLGAGTELHRFPVSSRPAALAARPGPPGHSELAIGGDDGFVAVWDVADGQFVRSMVGDPSRVLSLAYSADGRRLALSTRSVRVYLFDAADGRPLMEVAGAVSGSTTVGLNRDGSRLTVSGTRARTRVWNTTAEQSMLELRGHLTSPRKFGCNAGEGLLLTLAHREVRVWDASDGSLLTQLPLSGSQGAIWHDRELILATGDEIGVYGWVPIDGPAQAPGTRARSLRRLRRMSIGRQIHGLLGVLPAGDGSATKFVVHDRMAVFSIDGTSGPRVLAEYELPIVGLATDAECRFAVSCHYESFARLRSLVEDGVEHRLDSGGGVVQRVAIDPAGTHCVVADDAGAARVFDVATGQPRFGVQAGSHRLTAAAFDPTGAYFVLGSEDGACRVFRVADGVEITRHRLHRTAISEVAFAGPDRVISSDALSTVRVWPARPVELARSLPVRPLPLADRERFGVLSQEDRQLLRRIEQLDEKFLLKQDVRVQMRKELADRPERLALALDHIRDMRLNVRNRMFVDMPGAVISAEQSPAVYRRKLRLAEASVRSSPGEWSFQRNLGMAQYRNGQFEAARRSFDLVAQMARTPKEEPLIAAFSAMTFAKLGLGARARTRLGRLEEILAKIPNAVPPALIAEVRDVVGRSN